jgi:hypothetical protein
METDTFDQKLVFFWNTKQYREREREREGGEREGERGEREREAFYVMILSVRKTIVSAVDKIFIYFY